MAYDKDEWRASVTNGKIPARLLAEIEPRSYDADLDGPAVMHPEAARAMSDFLAAAPDGLRVKYSYRTYAKQWEKWQNYQNGGTLAAYPGTSNHGWAVACDLSWNNTTDINWAHAHAAEYGFKFDVLPSEPWHVVYYGGYTPPKPRWIVRGRVFRRIGRAFRYARKLIEAGKERVTVRRKP